MTTGITGRSPVQEEGRGRYITVENRQPSKSGQVQALQSSLRGPESFNQSVLQTPKRWCSSCSESIISCYRTSFKSLTDRSRDDARALFRSGTSSMVPAQRLVSLCNAYSNQVSMESSRFDLDNRLTQDLEKPTPQEKEVFCIENMNKSKATSYR